MFCRSKLIKTQKCHLKVNVCSWKIFLCSYKENICSDVLSPTQRIMWKHSLFELYLDRFRKFYFKFRTIPSFSTCMEVIWVNSKSAVHRFFQQMVDHEYLLKREWIYYPGERLVSLPFFESVRAGLPMAATNDVADQISVESYLIEHPTTTVLLKVKWDSMIDAGLQEWDVLVVDRAQQPKQWDIVIGIVDQEYTVKYLEKDNRWLRYLKPWNKNYEDIYPEQELELFWLVTWSFRRY